MLMTLKWLFQVKKLVFTDDTNLFIPGCTFGDVTLSATIKLNQLCDWLTASKPSVNVEKTK